MTVDLGLALGVLHSARRPGRRRQPGQLRPDDAHAIRVSGYGELDNALNVKKNFKNFAPRTGVSWRLDQNTVVRAGYGAGTIPFPDNRYAFNFPVKQNYSGSAANGFQRAGLDGGGLPRSDAVSDPVGWRSSRSPGSLLNSTFDVISPDLREGHAALLERGVPAPAAVTA